MKDIKAKIDTLSNAGLTDARVKLLEQLLDDADTLFKDRNEDICDAAKLAECINTLNDVKRDFDDDWPSNSRFAPSFEAAHEIVMNYLRVDMESIIRVLLEDAGLE
jgi:hypothetical protein